LPATAQEVVMPDPIDPSQPTRRSARLRSLARRVYPFRVLGMGLGVIPVLVTLHELSMPWPAWVWTVFCGLVWPHVAFHLHACRSRDPSEAELRNLTIDSALTASLLPLMQFTLLPSVMVLTVAAADKISSGVRGLWRHSIPAMVIGLLATGLLTGFAVRLETSMTVLMACLPMLVVHTLAVAMGAYHLIRRVQMQNLRLDTLSRFDVLTGLENRGHWQEHAAALLQRHHAGRSDATLVLIDADHFKSVNDNYGHAAGDDVLRGIGDVLRRVVPADGHAGRLGGDEFAVVLPLAETGAHAVAEAIRAGVTALSFAEWPELRATVSIGLASPGSGDDDLRQWSQRADRALYASKSRGRNAVSQTRGEAEATA
jgi:diguanylate cyclase